ncbi:hypothetical protein [Virgibacillus proomii]|uniref:hypothetical protein n=1 Tax=Virgibacillus proomii TaxID=84407 RepID=UPI001C10CBFE|nr:hypothetical protein [Virgibacillus proomii]MBU5266231.1 hypothetical protein [Virgibacillus proomii]
MLTKKQLEEITQRANKATEGKWDWVPVVDDETLFITGEDGNEAVAENVYTPQDAIFIANSRQDVPNLLEHISKQEAEIERLIKREQEATELLRFDTVLMDKYVTEISKLRGLLENVIENGQCSTIDNIIKEL